MSGFDPIYDDALDRGDACELDRLLHPSQAFDRPADVVNDPDLSLDEKRAILASFPMPVRSRRCLRCATLPGENGSCHSTIS